MTTKEKLCNEIHKIINTELENNKDDKEFVSWLKVTLSNMFYDWYESFDHGDYHTFIEVLRRNETLKDNEYLNEIFECFAKAEEFVNSISDYHTGEYDVSVYDY